jgi:hypothetical protein
MKIVSVFVFGALTALIAAGPALAASADYYLVIDGIDGEASSAAKVSSWSFGASQTSSAPMPSGRTTSPLYEEKGRETDSPLAGAKASAVTAREAGSGMATGRRQHQPVIRKVVGDLDGDGGLDFAEAGQLAEVDALQLSLPPEMASSLCGKTDHLRSGHILSSDGTVYDLGTIKTACMGSDGAATRLALTGSMKHTKTGHVTLMK